MQSATDDVATAYNLFLCRFLQPFQLPSTHCNTAIEPLQRHRLSPFSQLTHLAQIARFSFFFLLPHWFCSALILPSLFFPFFSTRSSISIKLKPLNIYFPAISMAAKQVSSTWLCFALNLF